MHKEKQSRARSIRRTLYPSHTVSNGRPAKSFPSINQFTCSRIDPSHIDSHTPQTSHVGSRRRTGRGGGRRWHLEVRFWAAAGGVEWMMCGTGAICDIHATSIKQPPPPHTQPQSQRGSSGGIVTRERRRLFGGTCGPVSGGRAGLGVHRPAPIGGSGGACLRMCCPCGLWSCCVER